MGVEIRRTTDRPFLGAGGGGAIAAGGTSAPAEIVPLEEAIQLRMEEDLSLATYVTRRGGVLLGIRRLQQRSA